MADGMYEVDVLVWAEQQAGLLRRLAAGERVNDSVDWANVIEEVQDVGLSELRSMESLLVQAMIHLMKAHSWPDSMARQHWLNEVPVFVTGAQRSTTVAMRQRIDVDGLYADAMRVLRATTDGSGEARALPARSPWTLDALVDEDIEMQALLGMLG